MDETYGAICHFLLESFGGLDEEGQYKSSNVEQFNVHHALVNNLTYRVVNYIERDCNATLIPQPENGVILVVTGINDDDSFKHGLYFYEEMVTYIVLGGFHIVYGYDVDSIPWLNIVKDDYIFKFFQIDGEDIFIVDKFTGNPEKLSEMTNELKIDVKWARIHFNSQRLVDTDRTKSLAVIDKYLAVYAEMAQTLSDKIQIVPLFIFNHIYECNFRAALLHQNMSSMSDVIPEIAGEAYEFSKTYDLAGPFKNQNTNLFSIYQLDTDTFRCVKLNETYDETIIYVLPAHDFSLLLLFGYIEYPESSKMNFLMEIFKTAFSITGGGIDD